MSISPFCKPLIGAFLILPMMWKMQLMWFMNAQSNLEMSVTSLKAFGSNQERYFRRNRANINIGFFKCSSMLEQGPVNVQFFYILKAILKIVFTYYVVKTELSFLDEETRCFARQKRCHVYLKTVRKMWVAIIFNAKRCTWYVFVMIVLARFVLKFLFSTISDKPSVTVFTAIFLIFQTNVCRGGLIAVCWNR